MLKFFGMTKPIRCELIQFSTQVHINLPTLKALTAKDGVKWKIAKIAILIIFGFLARIIRNFFVKTNDCSILIISLGKALNSDIINSKRNIRKLYEPQS
jgi:hypothetical protein